MLAIRPAMAAVGRWLRSVRPERAHLRAEHGRPGCPVRSAACPTEWRPRSGWSESGTGALRSFAGPIVGGLSSNTRLMVISATSAAALAAGSALQNVAPDQRPAAIALLVILVGIALVAAGIARLGRYTRFVSYSVMIGFLSGISVNIVCSQIADLTGTQAHGDFPSAKAIDVLIHPPGPSNARPCSPGSARSRSWWCWRGPAWP